MIENINELSSLIINILILIGIGFLVYFYCVLKNIDSKIETKQREFENRRDEEGKRTTLQSFMDKRIAKLETDRSEFIAPLERKKQRILSKIPFIK